MMRQRPLATPLRPAGALAAPGSGGGAALRSNKEASDSGCSGIDEVVGCN